MSVTDPDSSLFSFAVSDNRFEVVNNQLKLKDTVSLNFESESGVALSITVTDDSQPSQSYTETFSITVLNANEAPTAVDDALTLGDAMSVIVNVLANDTDVENDTLTITSTTQGANGSVLINPDSTVTYIPNPGFVGNDSFTYTVSDGIDGFDTATVNVTVQPVSIFDNSNISGVFNSPSSPTTFSISSPYVLTSLRTYHWNNGQGDTPDNGIYLSDTAGNTFGPWPITTSSGSGGTPNVDWFSDISIAIPAGTYTVVDPNPDTWSHNSASGNAGFVTIQGRPVDVLISDTEFSDSNWTAEPIQLNNGASVTATQANFQTLLPGQGNARRMVHTQTPAQAEDTNVSIFHEFQAASYTPSVSGAILAVDYSEDFIHFDPPFSGAEVLWGPAIQQNGTIYINPTDRFSNAANFVTGQLNDLDQTDFTSASGDGSNPDFSSSGGTITFGYFRATSHTGPITEIREHGIDNWQFTLTTA